MRSSTPRRDRHSHVVQLVGPVRRARAGPSGAATFGTRFLCPICGTDLRAARPGQTRKATAPVPPPNERAAAGIPGRVGNGPLGCGSQPCGPDLEVIAAMASTLLRRPLPALIALFALLLLTALVWWRVLHRADESAG